MKQTITTIVKRTQRDYNLGFKLAIVEQVEKGELTYKQAQKNYGIQGRNTVLVWLRKHGRLDWTNPDEQTMPKSKETPSKTIKCLEKAHSDEKKRNLILNGMVDIFDQEHGAGLRKKHLAEVLSSSKKKAR